jgi:glycine/D-amino acid oxidase-like deaminating enzyme
MANISIVGTGAVGTAIALELQAQGHRISLIAETLPGNKQITSDLAAGIGCIFKPSSPLVAELVLDSYEDYMSLAHSESCAPVQNTKLNIVTHNDKMPAWASRVKDYTVISETRATYDTYSFHPGQLGNWRVRTLEENGATIKNRTLSDMEIEALRDGNQLKGDDYTILTMGLSTRDILPELHLYPVRGVLVHFGAGSFNYTASKSYMNEDSASYIIDRPGGPIIGGTFDRFVGSCTEDQKLEIGARIVDNAVREFCEDELARERFNFQLREDITAGYRPAVSGDPILDYGDKNRRVAVITGFSGQGWVTGFELARRVREHVESNMFPSAVV